MVLQVVDLKITHQNQSQYIDRKTIYIRIKKLYRFPHLLQNIYSCSRLNAIGDLVHKCMGEIRKNASHGKKGTNRGWSPNHPRIQTEIKICEEYFILSSIFRISIAVSDTWDEIRYFHYFGRYLTQLRVLPSEA